MSTPGFLVAFRALAVVAFGQIDSRIQ